MHIVIAGYPRSGSTMLTNMLRSTVTNFKFFDSEMKALAVPPNSGNVITKRPWDISVADTIALRIPDVRFLVCVRDPRSVITSKHYQAPDEYKVSWDKAIRYVHPDGKIDYMEGLIYWDDHIRKVPRPTYMFFENLISRPQLEQQRLQKLFGFQYNGKRFADFWESEIPERLSVQLNGIRPLDVDRKDSWRKNPERVIEQFESCAYLHELLYKYRYEMDEGWLDWLKLNIRCDSVEDK